MCVWWSGISYGLWAAQARSRFPAESSVGSPAPSKHLSQKRKEEGKQNDMHKNQYKKIVMEKSRNKKGVYKKKRKK